MCSLLAKSRMYIILEFKPVELDILLFGTESILKGPNKRVAVKKNDHPLKGSHNPQEFTGHILKLTGLCLTFSLSSFGDNLLDVTVCYYPRSWGRLSHFSLPPVVVWVGEIPAAWLR